MSSSEKELLDRLGVIHHRVQWMADEEARSVWIGGAAAQGIFIDQKIELRG
jgi:hypothetical protein